MGKSTNAPGDMELLRTRIRTLFDDTFETGQLAQVLDSMAATAEQDGTKPPGQLDHAGNEALGNPELARQSGGLEGLDSKTEVLRLIQEVSSLRFNNVSLRKQVDGLAAEIDELKKVNDGLVDVVQRSRPDSACSTLEPASVGASPL